MKRLVCSGLAGGPGGREAGGPASRSHLLLYLGDLQQCTAPQLYVAASWVNYIAREIPGKGTRETLWALDGGPQDKGKETNQNKSKGR